MPLSNNVRKHLIAGLADNPAATELADVVDAAGNLFEGLGADGLVPDPVTESGKFLRDDGTWADGGGSHPTSDGSSHADVATNTTHTTSDGTDHTHIDQDVKTSASPTFDIVTVGGVVAPKASGTGVKIDPASPDWGWRDMLGGVHIATSGPNRPTLQTFRGNIEAYGFAAGEVANFVYHVPHDYALGTDLHLHLHWAHNGTAISGSLVTDAYLSYAKGHDQAGFPVEVAPQIIVSTPNIATIPQYRHRVDEIQISTSGGSATMLDTDDIEPDGIILLQIDTSTIPTITGGTVAEVFLFTADVHYQSTGLPTKNKAPDFYT